MIIGAKAGLISGSGAFAPLAVTLDGTNDYLNRGADLTGNADGSAGTISFWFKMNGGNGVQQFFHGIADPAGTQIVQIDRKTDNLIRILLRDSAAANLLLVDTASTYQSGAGWKHFLSSWNLSTPVSYIYVSDSSDKGVPTTETTGTIDYTRTDHTIGADSNNASKLNADLAEFWMSRSFIDISSESNRRKFITSDLKPVDLGSDGSIPTGAAPIIYQSVRSGDAATAFATNRGTGGNFTITGTLDLVSPSPWA